MDVIKSIFTVGGYTTLYRITSVIRDALQTAVLGAGPITDAFAVAFKLANLLRKLFAEGAFNAAFLPRFTNVLSKDGKIAASVLASQVLSQLALILTIFAVFFLSCFPSIIKALAPGFAVGSVQYSYAVEFGYICFPFAITSFIAALFGGILNAFNKFAVPAAVQMTLNICLIIALLFGYFGLPRVGHMMAWATMTAGILQVMILWINVNMYGINVRITTRRPSAEAFAIIKRIIPGAVGAGVWQINVFIGCISLASFLPSGSVSYVYYTDHINQIPLGIMGVSLGIVLLPPLTKFLQSKDLKRGNAQFNMGIIFGLALILPATVVLSVLAEPITAAFYGHGKFGSAEIRNAAPVLTAFALGLPSYILTKIFSTAFFAQKNVQTPVIAGGIALAANLVSAFFFIQAFNQINLGHVGIAAAISASSWINVAVLYAAMVRRKQLHILSKSWIVCLKLLLVSGVMAVSAYMMDLYTNNAYSHGSLGQTVIIITIIVISGLIFWILGKSLGCFKAITELQAVASYSSVKEEE
ncbi:MAG: murein biosynthesis integral membrane protein MurJ [Holosporales bacterium]|nr:murein biosynthesis integral membrane protein MurJ [Holosporales bacterium]